MLKKVLALCGLFLLFGYQFYKEKTDFVIDMNLVSNDSVTLNFNYVNTDLKTLDRFPIFKNKVIKEYKGVPIHDSIGYYGNFENGLQISYDLYKSHELDKNDFFELMKRFNADTLNFSQKPLKQGFISIVGFYKNKQFVIADANRNKDFSDDIKYEFDINFRKEYDSLVRVEKLPLTDYNYETYLKGHIQTYKRKIVLYPSMFDIHSVYNKKEAEYVSSFKFKDYWRGEQLIDNVVYDFSYQALDNIFGAIYIKPKGIPFRRDESFNKQFMHYTSDTIAIANGYYKIDSINRKISKLYLRKIRDNKEKYGQEAGSYFKNRVIDDLDNGKFSLDTVIKKKEYTLLDFWGTWCGPCIRMTPKLIALQNKYKSKLNIVGIANDSDKSEVKKHVIKTNMNWIHGFINHQENNWLYTEMNISAFPTLILLDSKGKILLRGGSEEFNNIEKIIR